MKLYHSYRFVLFFENRFIPLPSLLIHPMFCFCHFILLGVVHADQKNATFIDMQIFDDGPYEVGDESLKDESLVPVPANSYLGRTELFKDRCPRLEQ